MINLDVGNNKEIIFDILMNNMLSTQLKGIQRSICPKRFIKVKYSETFWWFVCDILQIPLSLFQISSMMKCNDKWQIDWSGNEERLRERSLPCS